MWLTQNLLCWYTLDNMYSFARPRLNRNQRTRKQIAELKEKYRCRNCGLRDHWHSDHTPNGTLKLADKASKVRFSESFKKSRNFSSKPHPYRKTMTFNTAKFNDESSFSSCYVIGILVYGGARSSALGLVELKILSPYLHNNGIGKLDPLRPTIVDCTHWQYGSGSYFSDSQWMLGSTMISARLNDGPMINIWHFAVEGSSQWLIGRNATTKRDIIYSSGNYLKWTDRTKISLKNIVTYSYVPSYIFFKRTNTSCSNYHAKLFCATGNIHDPIY